MSRSSGVRAAAWRGEEGFYLSHEERYNSLRKARYPEARAEDIQRRQVELEHSTAWALVRSERLPLDIPYSPTYSDVEDSKEVESADDELFRSDS